MADTSLFGEIGGQFAEKFFSGILYFGIGIMIAAAVVFTLWFFVIYKRKFDIEVKIKSNRAEDNYSVLKDRAAIIKDYQTKIPYFRVWSLKRDFPVPKYKVLQKTNKGDLLELYRESEDKFYFLTPPTINKTHIYNASGKYIPVAEQSQIRFDPEDAEWLANRIDKNKKMLNTESLLMKVLPYIPHIMGGVILIFLLYILMDSLPGILSELRQLAATLNQMKAASVTTYSG